jgi:hypothetical protein
MTTETARCPFCFKAMTIEGNAWQCETHGTFPGCPTCGDALTTQQAKPPTYWCAPGRVWFDGDLKQISRARHLE